METGSFIKLENSKVRDSSDLPHGLVAESPAMRDAVTFALQAAAKTGVRIILLVGPTGTGKNLLAELIHRKSPQFQKPFISVNCAATPEELMESEYFGHFKGAFTGAHETRKGRFELAQQGFIFLNEINETNKNFQRKLLGVLDDWEIWPIGSSKKVDLNVRVILASSQDLKRMIESREFLEPLYYRISAITINIPPLCERVEDIQPLAEAFLRKESPDRLIKISSEALTLLKAFSWPGNARELENEITRIVFKNEDIKVVQPEHLSEEIREGVTLNTSKKISMNLEKDRIVQALMATHGNITRAAKALAIPRSTLQYKINRLELPNFRQN